MVGRVLDFFSPRRRAEKMAPFVAEALRQQAKNAIAARSASIPAPVVPGTGQRFTGSQVADSIDMEQQRLFGSEGARRGRATSRTGPTPRAYANHPEITIDRIARIHTHVERNGWMWDKADLDARILREHEHLQPADRARRAWIFQTHPRIVPRNDSVLALLVRNAVEAVLDDLDSFDGSVSELQIANGSGGALSEIVWKRRPLRVVTGPRKAVMVESETVQSLEPVPLRSVAFDVHTDRAYVNQGNWGWVDPFADPESGEPLRKVVLHRGFGDGDIRMRGYMFAAHHLHWMSKLSWEKAGNLVEVYGVSTPYLQPEDDGQNIRDEDYALGEEVLADLGKAIPAIIPRRLGKVELTPTPTAVTPIQQAMIGFCYTGMSKLVTGQTLAMEIGNVGSYNATDTHADQQEQVQRIDARLTCGSLNAQLLRFIVELNAEAWAYAFAAHCPEECTPLAILQCVPRITWDVSRKLSKPDRLKMFIDAKKEGLSIDGGQVYEECGFRPALTAESAFGGARGLTEPPRPPDPKPSNDGDAPALDAPPSKPSPAEQPPTGKIELTSTDLGVIVTVNEARKDLGLAPIPNGDQTIAELKATVAAPPAGSAPAPAESP